MPPKDWEAPRSRPPTCWWASSPRAIRMSTSSWRRGAWTPGPFAVASRSWRRKRRPKPETRKARLDSGHLVGEHDDVVVEVPRGDVEGTPAGDEAQGRSVDVAV